MRKRNKKIFIIAVLVLVGMVMPPISVNAQPPTCVWFGIEFQPFTEMQPSLIEIQPFCGGHHMPGFPISPPRPPAWQL